MSSAAVIVAAGASRRMGLDKLMANVGGRPLLQWTLDAFLRCGAIDRIVVVGPEERFAQLATSGPKEVLRVDGGAERYHSVVAGLREVRGSDIVAVQDGARPLVTPPQIEECLQAARDHGAAALARRVTETLKRATDEDMTCGPVPRENLWIMETPQVFRTATLIEAYEHVGREGLQVTDDVSAAEAIGVPTRLVENRDPNLKATTPADLVVIERLLAARGG
jgi:2-C-methyl-D-erythritol 4-phosphate cytidylyltransferase